MEQIPPPKEVKILETAEDIQERREEVQRLLISYFILIWVKTKIMVLGRNQL